MSIESILSQAQEMSYPCRTHKFIAAEPILRLVYQLFPNEPLSHMPTDT